MTTTIRVTTATRDRLTRLITEQHPGKTVDEVLGLLLDENWRARAIADADRFREEDPQGWQEYLRDADHMDRGWSRDLPLPEYKSDDPEWVAATKDAA